MYKLVNRLDTSDICVLASDILSGTRAVAETSHHRNLNCTDAGYTFFPLLWGWSDGFYLWTAVTNFPVWMSMEAKTHVFLFQRLCYNSHQLWPYQNAHSQITGVLFLMVHSTIFSALQFSEILLLAVHSTLQLSAETLLMARSNLQFSVEFYWWCTQQLYQHYSVLLRFCWRIIVLCWFHRWLNENTSFMSRFCW